MKKLVYLIMLIAILGFIVSGCNPVVPPVEQVTTPAKAESLCKVTVELEDSGGALITNSGATIIYQPSSSGAYVNFGDGAIDADGTEKADVPAGTHRFRLTYQGCTQEKQLWVGEGSIVTYQTHLVTVELRDASDNLVTSNNATIVWQSGSSGSYVQFGSNTKLQTDGWTSMETLPLTHRFRMTYLGTTQEKHTNSATVTYQTHLVTVELKNSSGNLIQNSNATIIYQPGSIGSYVPFGSNAELQANGWTSMETLPLTNRYRMTYLGATQEKQTDSATVTYQTTNVKLHFSGTITYQSGGSGPYNPFPKSPSSLELLPASYRFRFDGGYEWQTSISGSLMEKTIAYLRVLKSNGITGQDGVTFIWQIHGSGLDQPVPGSTDSKGVLLHIMDGYNNSLTRYLPTYLGGVGPRRDPRPATESFVNWQLINVTVKLTDVDNDVISDATPLVTFEYPGGGRRTFGNLFQGQLSKEMMPTSGYVAFFIDDYNKTKQRKDASPMNTSPFVHTFQCGKIVDDGYNVFYFRIYGGQNNSDLATYDWLWVLPNTQFYFYHATQPRLGPIAIGAGQTLTLNSDYTYSITP